MLFLTSAALADAPYAWYLPGKSGSVVAETYLVLNAASSTSIVICYLEGDKDSYVQVNSSQGDGTQTSRLYLGGCMKAFGTKVWIKNGGNKAAGGTFQ